MIARRALAPDAQAIARIHVESWKVAYRGIMPDEVIARTDLAFRTTFWSERLADHGGPVFLIEERGEPVAFCHLIPTPDPDDDATKVGHITALHVLPQLRGRGYGRALLELACNDCRSRGFSEVTLWVLDANTKAREFYEKRGFRNDGGKKMHSRTTTVPEVRYRAKL
jgi:ribosomal protein S18 acetylase RimI-like enzyme